MSRTTRRGPAARQVTTAIPGKPANWQELPNNRQMIKVGHRHGRYAEVTPSRPYGEARLNMTKRLTLSTRPEGPRTAARPHNCATADTNISRSEAVERLSRAAFVGLAG